MEQRDIVTRQRVNGRRAAGLLVVTRATTQAKVSTQRRAAERFGDDMIDLERHSDDRDCRLAVGTTVLFLFSNQSTQ